MADENLSLSTPEETSLGESLSPLDFEEMDFGDNPLIKLLEKLMGLPGMRVNRTSLLCETYHLSKTDIESKDVSELISLEQMDSAAKKFITKNVTQSSMAAFGLGLPGGFAMALTIPADIMQGFGFSLRLAQQLAYLYGFEDLFADGGRMTAKTRNTLVAFLGIMFAASGSGTLLRAIAPNIGKFAAKKVMGKPLTKTVWYPMLKKVASAVASKTITKKGVSEVASKAVPVVGGVVSAGITVATMVPMANRLKNELRKYYLSEEEIRELEEREQAKPTLGDKASDAISSVAAGSVKAAGKVKDAGKGINAFTKKVSAKTKEKIDKGRSEE